MDCSLPVQGIFPGKDTRVGCHFLLHFFAVQNLLIRSHLFVSLLCPLFYKTDPKKYCCSLCQRVFCLFSTRKFILSDLTFRSLIHFEFIFVFGIRECSNFILHVTVKFSQHHLLRRRLSFLHCVVLPPLL